MENAVSPSRIHPLVAGAAVSVILASAVGIASLTGLLPTANHTPAAAVAQTPKSETAAEPKAAPAHVAAVANTPVVKAPVRHVSHAAPVVYNERPTYVQHSAQAQPAPAPQYTPSAPAPAPQAASTSGLGIATGAVIGGLLGNQVGGGKGRTLATIAGAVGGGYVGNEVEKRVGQ